MPSRIVSGCGGHPGTNRSTGTVEAAPSSDSGLPAKGPPEIAHAPTAITIFGEATASQVFSRARRMPRVTGPVTNSPSACRGEATNLMPNRPMSHPMVVRTLLSASHALHPPALTCAEAERPSEQPAGGLLECRGEPQRLAAQDEVLPRAGCEPMIPAEGERSRRARLGAVGAEQAPAEVDLDRGARGAADGPRRTRRDTVGALPRARDTSTTGRPRNRSLSAGGLPRGYRVVLNPCRIRSVSIVRIVPCPYRSCPQYERLKLLLQSGKSEIWPSRMASASPSQLWNDGSTTLYDRTVPRHRSRPRGSLSAPRPRRG